LAIILNGRKQAILQEAFSSKDVGTIIGAEDSSKDSSLELTMESSSRSDIRLEDERLPLRA